MAKSILSTVGLCWPAGQAPCTLTLDGVVLGHNTVSVSGGTNAFPEGGGIVNDGTLTLGRSTVSSNTASGTGATSQNTGGGGEIFNNGSAR